MEVFTRRQQIRRRSAESAFLRRFGPKIAEAAQTAPIVDVACGSGRNAIFLAFCGCDVICLDKDLSRLDSSLRSLAENTKPNGRIVPVCLDLEVDHWPFGPSSLGGVVNVHYLLPRLFPDFARSLKRGAYLLLETPGGHGGNYLELPRRGAVPSALKEAFAFEFCAENKTGPKSCDAVTVRLLAKRK